MKEDKLHISELKECFKSKLDFTSEDLTYFYKAIQCDINPATIKTRIFRLVDKGIIKRNSSNLYTFGNEKKYTPTIDTKLKSLYKKLSIQFPNLKICVWNTNIINEFMLHQPSVFFTIVEIETDKDERLMYAQSVFNYIRELTKSVYLSPNRSTFNFYTSENKNSIIVLPLVSEAPLLITDNVKTITIEKLLVDLFCEETFLVAQQGIERETIFKEAFQKYTINQSKLLRYASRRNQKIHLASYLQSMNLI